MSCSRKCILALLLISSGCSRADVEPRSDASEARPSINSLPTPDRPQPRPIIFTQCGNPGIMHGPTTTAGFELDAIETLVARDHAAIEACWEGRPLIPRRSAVRIEIARSGEVTRIHPDAFDRSDESMETCLARAVATWKLPPSADPVCLQIPVGDPSDAVTPSAR